MLLIDKKLKNIFHRPTIGTGVYGTRSRTRKRLARNFPATNMAASPLFKVPNNIFEPLPRANYLTWERNFATLEQLSTWAIHPHQKIHRKILAPKRFFRSSGRSVGPSDLEPAPAGSGSAAPHDALYRVEISALVPEKSPKNGEKTPLFGVPIWLLKALTSIMTLFSSIFWRGSTKNEPISFKFFLYGSWKDSPGHWRSFEDLLTL